MSQQSSGSKKRKSEAAIAQQVQNDMLGKCDYYDRDRFCGEPVLGNLHVCYDHAVRDENDEPTNPKDVGNCAFCGKKAFGNFSIHRDGLGDGPEVPLCTDCGGNPEPQEVEIWSKIGQAEICIKCDEEIRHDDARKGSFHAWCFQ